jgi:retron-type reverse transcriptase
MTPGINGETADGMSPAKIGRIIDALRHERYRFQPLKRVYIPKKNGKQRPLGLPSWSDHLLSCDRAGLRRTAESRRVRGLTGVAQLGA